MKTIDDYSFKGQRVLIRVDFNVPLDAQYTITDDTRIRAAVPTIKKILNDGGSVILMSHLGRPKEGPTEKYSLKHIVNHLSKLLNVPVAFAADCIGNVAKSAANSLKPGEVLLLENLRFYKQEEKGDVEFAKQLSELGTFYVNDAFGTAHRAHASTAIIAQFFQGNKCFGYVMSGELASVDKVLNKSEKPFTAIMGGAKVSDKILILEQLINKANNIIIGGGMAFTFVKAQGGTIGNSLVEEDKLQTALNILKDAKAKGVNIYIPVDAIVANAFANDAEKQTVDIKSIPDGWMGLDIGPASEKIFAEVISNSRTILWNGPMGVFEMSNYEHGTKSAAEAIVAATKKGAFSLIGGGDSVAAINKYHFADDVSYVSTGGGALLEYIESGSLPGVEAIEK
ncbi:MAG: phosphoglycerate kinase [Bacteroidetes bacterium RIFCSPLOWO2_12_FULL_35_15]|nr:MAG: phosphoglycerate kinase [Bacteroidetes bacterium RIFCSPLOWO2_12_FULL_35_15]